jgi:hypothetical protein
VIASQLAGDAADVLDNGRYGLLFAGWSADALADALLRQVSPEAIGPGDRASRYELDDILGRYAGVIADAAGRATVL